LTAVKKFGGNVSKVTLGGHLLALVRSTPRLDHMATLKVGVAYRDPPFNGMPGGGGLDVDLIDAIGSALGLTVERVAYGGGDFNGIFVGLNADAYDCVIAGTSITPDRERMADFAAPYLISGQSLAVNTDRLRNVRSVDDLAGLTIGVQRGNTSQPMAEELVAKGKARAVRLYDYGDVGAALADLGTGACDAFMKLGPVLTELVRDVPDVEVVQRGISRELIAIAVARGDEAMLARITDAQAGLEADGTLQGIRRKWLGNPYVDQSLAAH
jgi:ABC-type amino acid transport substrate-binding protein